MHTDRKVRDILVWKQIDVFQIKYIISLNLKRKKTSTIFVFVLYTQVRLLLYHYHCIFFLQNLFLATTPTIIITKHLLKVLNPKIAMC